MARKSSAVCVGVALLTVFVAAVPGLAQTSFSNSLTGFSGNSTQAEIQTALDAAGFNVFDIRGFTEDPPGNFFDPTVVLDSNGASFGTAWGSDGGRNYMRTNDSNYATASFVAEITVERTDGFQQVFIGMGAGDTALFGVPDWSTLNSSTFVTPEDGSLTTWRSANDANEWCPSCAAEAVVAAGTHRVRMEFDRPAMTMTYSIDLDYAGGPFIADAVAPTTDLSHIDCPSGCGDPPMPISADFFAADGWPNEPSRIFFGGDDGAIFRDFSVVVSAPPAVDGDFNSDGSVDAADYVMWRKNDGSNNALPNDGGLGIPITSAHYELWRSNYSGAAGGGSVLEAIGVPEPTSVVLVIVGLIGGWAARRPKVA